MTWGIKDRALRRFDREINREMRAAKKALRRAKLETGFLKELRGAISAKLTELDDNLEGSASVKEDNINLTEEIKTLVRKASFEERGEMVHQDLIKKINLRVKDHLARVGLILKKGLKAAA